MSEYDGQFNSQNGFSYQEPEKPEKPKKKHTVIKILIPVLLAVALGTGIYFTIDHLVDSRTEKKEAKIERELPTETPDTTAVAEEKADDTVKDTNVLPDVTDKEIEKTETKAYVTVLDVSDIVDHVMPSVVAITDNLELTQDNYYNPYNYFFGGGKSSGGGTQETTASGSGVIFAETDSELLIVTNNHVVSNEGQSSYYTISSKGLNVQFCDGTIADATIRGTDSQADLAVISIKLSDLSEETQKAIKVAVVGNSDELKVGQGVIAIGNALGYGQSVTTGIISAKDREITIDGVTRKLMQTDAAINPGNSGGGLFNANGELVGINSAKSVDTDVEGMGFAIPITSAEEIIDELMNTVQIPDDEKGYLGINGETVPSNYVTNYGYPEGVSVTRIGEGSPAEKSGLQIYDIITAVNDKAVAAMADLQHEVQKHAAGETITLTVRRPEGRSFKELKIEVTLATAEEVNKGLTEKSESPKKEEEEPKKPENDGNDKKDEDNEDEDEGGGSLFDYFFNRGNDDEDGEDGYDNLFDWFFNNF